MRKKWWELLMVLVVILMSLYMYQSAKADSPNVEMRRRDTCPYCGVGEWDGDACSNCGVGERYGYECLFCGLKYEGYMLEHSYRQHDDIYHYEHMQWVVGCRYCRRSIYWRAWKETKIHTFVDGKCVCGYTQSSSPTASPTPSITPMPDNCSHSIESTLDKSYYGDDQYLIENDTMHKIVRYYNLVCPHCHETVASGKRDESYEYHKLDNQGKCSRCPYGAAQNPYPTLTGFAVSSTSAKLGASISVQGFIDGNGAKLAGIAVAVRNVANESLGGYWIHETNLYADSYDLNSVAPLTLAGAIGNTSFGEGTWIVEVYANTEHGLGFEYRHTQTIVIESSECQHVYGYDYADISKGEWRKVDEYTHKRVTVLYKDVCIYCGNVRYERREDVGAVVESHTWGKTNWQPYKRRNESEHYRTGITSCTAAGCSATKNVVEVGAHEFIDGECACGETKVIFTVKQINEKIDEMFEIAQIAYNAAEACQYDNAFEEISVLLFTKGTGALTFGLKKVLTDEEIEKIVESMVLAEMDDIEYISNTVFADFEAWCAEQGFWYGDFAKIESLIRSYGITPDFSNGSWLDELGERIATSEDWQKTEQELEAFKLLQKTYSHFEIAYSGMGVAGSFTNFISSMQKNGRNYEMREYIRAISANRLETLKAGFTDQRIIDAIADYQWKIDNAIMQWSLDTMSTILKDGENTYGSYCKFVNMLQTKGVLKHIPKGAQQYLNAEKAFKDYKVGGKFTIKDILAGAKTFDTIATIESFLFDADGLTDLVSLLEREMILLASEYENMPVAKKGGSASALLTRVYALMALTDATLSSINDLVQLNWEAYTTGITGMFHMWFGSDTTLDEISGLTNQVYLLKRQLSDLSDELTEMIQNCPDLE